MNINRWDPFRDFGQVLAGHLVPTVSAHAGAWQPPTDIREDGEAYHLDLELPAVPAEDVQIELRDGVLRVAGERPAPATEGGRAFRREQRYGKFERRFRLPEDADADGVSASAKNGIVSVVVRKSQPAQARAIEVQAA